MSADKVSISMTVNGDQRQLRTWPMARLLDVLREELRLTGPKEGCGEGECGSCAVLLDGELVNSCLVPAVQADGAQIHTVEGLSRDPVGARLQDSFRKHGGAQCGICTPGMLMASFELLRHNPSPTLEEIRSALAGNLCRCTGYMKIFDSVQAAAEKA